VLLDETHRLVDVLDHEDVDGLVVGRDDAGARARLGQARGVTIR
jgi:hypothetical protein